MGTKNRDYAVKDIALAHLGRRQVSMAADEMPGLMALRKEYGREKPLAGARIMGSLHMTCETAVLIETLVELGARVRWASSNIFSTNDGAAAAIAQAGIPVFAIKGESLTEYWEFAQKALTWPDGEGPDLIVDDGGDAAVLLHQGYEAEQGKSLDALVATEDGRALKATIKKTLDSDSTFFSRAIKRLRGLSEETTTGVMRLLQLHKEEKLLFPAYNVNDAVTKSKFDNTYGARESLVDAIKRATDIMVAGKSALVCGFGHVGKGAAEALAAHKARVLISEVDPICGLQALMAGYSLVNVEKVLPQVDIIVTATGNKDVITVEHMRQMKDCSILCNIGHFDCEIQMAELNALKGVEREVIKPQTSRYTLPEGHSIYILAEGRLVNLGCATGHPSFVMSTSFTNQVLAQLALWQKKHNIGVFELDKKSDEYVARLHLAKLGGSLTELTSEQANYIGVPQSGPFKENSYRY